jgi:hypothetical protein
VPQRRAPKPPSEVRRSRPAEQPRWIVTSMTLRVSDTVGSTPDFDCRVGAVLTNHGRTPAAVTRTAFQSRLAVLLDSKPRYALAGSTPTEAFGTTLVPSGGSYTVTLDSLVHEEDVETLRRGTTHLWPWGYLSYRTYLDEHMVEGFIEILDAHPTRRLPMYQQDQPRLNYGRLIEGALRQPPADARVQAYVLHASCSGWRSRDHRGNAPSGALKPSGRSN